MVGKAHRILSTRFKTEVKMRVDWYAHRRMEKNSRGRKVLKKIKTSFFFLSFGSGEVALSQGNTSKKVLKLQKRVSLYRRRTSRCRVLTRPKRLIRR